MLLEPSEAPTLCLLELPPPERKGKHLAAHSLPLGQERPHRYSFLCAPGGTCVGARQLLLASQANTSEKQEVRCGGCHVNLLMLVQAVATIGYG